MRIGLFAALVTPFATPGYLAALGRGAEERGFSSLWVAEHVILFDEYESRYPYAADGRIPAGGEFGIPEPFTNLAFLAAHTSTIRLGTGICLVPQRNPVYTAKDVAAVDWLSNGRLDFGIGVGWLAEEFRALGVPFERRGARCREYVEVMRRLWEDEVSEHHGEFYDLPPCRHYPKPVQRPHPPIHFGGESDAALRRVADLGQGWYGFSVLPEDLPEHLGRLRGFCADTGRDPRSIEVSICPYTYGVDMDAVRAYAEAGVDQLVLVFFAADESSVEPTLDSLAATFVGPAAGL